MFSSAMKKYFSEVVCDAKKQFHLASLLKEAIVAIKSCYVSDPKEENLVQRKLS